MVGDSIFHVFIIEDWQVNFYVASPSFCSIISHGFKCLKSLDLSDLNDTDEEVDAELWWLLNAWSVKVKGGGGWSTHSPSSTLALVFSVNLSLSPCMMAQDHTWAPPIAQQRLGTLLPLRTGPLYESWMVATPVEWNEHVWVLWVQCIIWWQAWVIKLPTITQTYQFGTELGLFADQADSTQQCECSILHLTQAQSFS